MQVLSTIGENFLNSEEVCGCVISMRKSQDKIALWTADAENTDAILSIGCVSFPYWEHHHAFARVWNLGPSPPPTPGIPSTSDQARVCMCPDVKPTVHLIRAYTQATNERVFGDSR